MSVFETGAVPQYQSGVYADAEVVLGADGHFYVAYRQAEGAGITVERWTGESWAVHAQVSAQDLRGDLTDIRDLDLAITHTGSLVFATLATDVDGMEQLGYATFDGGVWAYSTIDGVDTQADESFKGISLALGPDDSVHVTAVRAGDGLFAAKYYAPLFSEWASEPLWINTTPILPGVAELHDPKILVDAGGQPLITFTQLTGSPEDSGLVVLTGEDGTFAEPTVPKLMAPLSLQGASLRFTQVVLANDGFVLALGHARNADNSQAGIVAASYDLSANQSFANILPIGAPGATVSIGDLVFQEQTNTLYFLIVTRSDDAPTTIQVVYAGPQTGMSLGNTVTLPEGLQPSAVAFTVDANNDAMIVVYDAQQSELVYYVGRAYFVPNVTGDVLITGSATQGQTLTADTAELADEDGLGTFSYQWRADGQDIDGATGSTFTLTAAEVGKAISVVVRYVDAHGTPEEVVSDATDAVIKFNHVPVVSGLPTGTVAVTVGTKVPLPAIQVFDADGADVSLTVTVQSVNGTLAGLTGGQTVPGGFSFTGTAAQVNAWLAQGTFQAGSAGAASVILIVSDGEGQVPATLNYVAAPAVTPPPLVDGVPVVVAPGTSPEGTATHVITIPTVAANRPDSDPTSPFADIPLVVSGGKTLLQAQVPVGFGLTVSGPAAPSTGQESLTDLIREIRAHTEAGSSDQGALTGGGTSYLAGIDLSAPLLVQTVVPSTVLATGDARLGIAGTPTDDGGVRTALVLDARSLPTVLNLQTDGIDFLALIGRVDVQAGADTQSVWGDSAAQTVRLTGSGATVMTGGGDDTVVSSLGRDDAVAPSMRAAADAAVAEEATLVHGGAGTDTVRYEGTSDRFVITRDFAVTTVRSLDDASAVDTLINVERIAFADKGVAVDADASLGWLAGLYAQVLDRQAELGGIQYWAHAHADGMSAGEIALQFLHSAEASLVLDTDTPAARGVTVEAFYEGLLGRASDATGKAYWVNEIAKGASLADVAGAFLATPEGAGTALTQVQWDFFV